jgi:hypothetical protein
MKFSRSLYFLILLLSFAPSVSAGFYQGKGLNPKTSYIVYIPDKLDMKKRHPWILALSPDGNGAAAVSAMRQGCDDNGWILIASNNSKNGVSCTISDPLLLDTINTSIRTLAVDPANLYTGGLSGGAMVSHYLITRHPQLFKGAVINCGMISRDWGKELGYPSGKNIVFMTNPQDFRYKEIAADFQYVTSHGCNARWLEFPGGHRWAPPQSYSAAFKWLNQQAKPHK